MTYTRAAAGQRYRCHDGKIYTILAVTILELDGREVVVCQEETTKQSSLYSAVCWFEEVDNPDATGTVPRFRFMGNNLPVAEWQANFWRFRIDGWPFCPMCDHDELHSHLVDFDLKSPGPTIDEYVRAGLRCYLCTYQFLVTL